MTEEDTICENFYPDCEECPLVPYCIYESDLEMENESTEVIE